MRRRTRHPEDPWREATLEQVADFSAWLHQRITDRHADAVSRWILGVNAGDSPKLSRRQLAAFRGLLERYGPPRPISVPDRR